MSRAKAPDTPCFPQRHQCGSEAVQPPREEERSDFTRYAVGSCSRPSQKRAIVTTTIGVFEGLSSGTRVRCLGREGIASTEHSDDLIRLGVELFAEVAWEKLYRIAVTIPLDRQALVDFDDALWGPSLSRIANNRPNAPGTLGIPRHGITRCELEDRDVFRPLHYCAVYLVGADMDGQARGADEWCTS